MTLELLAGALLVTIATSIGAISAFYIKDICKVRYTILLAFSAGVMTYTALEMVIQAEADVGHFGVLGGFLLGLGFILLSEKILPHLHHQIKKTELPDSKKKAMLIVGTIALHNIPEGFAVAAAFAGSVPLGWFTATSMALQDAPEGALIAAPLICYGLEKKKAVGYGILSGVIEGLAAIIGFVFLSLITGVIPYALAFSAGAMTYVVVVEIMPDIFKDRKEVGAISFIIGIVLAVLLAGLFS
jgi:ZIP family zinc transporter